MAVLAVLHAGASYVPVAADQPTSRITQICADAELCLLLVCADDPCKDAYAPGLARMMWQCAVPVAGLAPCPVDPEQAAYIIYTSGSTGRPKGVAVSHRSALNTCVDINQRYRVSAEDRILALSALHFDLSVYDIFGVLGAGGGVVLVEESQRRDPAAWCELIDRHQISVWNTVPALFDMLLTYAEALELDSASRLRLVLLSGDWIGLDLPARYHARASQGRMVALGGATEASIWSNAYEVGEVSSTWRSIPYGMPLANQQYRVVDPEGRDCPDHVEGELWIGGAGVALGYFNDPERTRTQFVETDQGRWYRTGDMGRYGADGVLEFLGRRDRQVKIGGYRIELGEIDASLAHLAGVKSCLTLAAGTRERHLVTYVVPQGEALWRVVEADARLPASYADWFRFDCGSHGATEGGEAEAVACFLVQHLLLHELDFARGLSLDEAASHYGCVAGLRPLFADWLALLVAQGYLLVEDHRYRCIRPHMSRAEPVDACALTDALISHHHGLSQIMHGLRSPLTLLEHPAWSPESVALRLAGAAASTSVLAAVVKALAVCLQRPVRLVELGVRSGLAAAQLLPLLERQALEYWGMDESADYVLRARERLASHPNAMIRRWDRAAISDLRHSADVVWLNNALHRQPDVAAALADASALATAGGLIYIVEAAALTPQGLVSVELFADGGARPRDRLRGEQAWCQACQKQGLVVEAVDRVGQLLLFAARAPWCARMPDIDTLQRELGERLPAYMIPARVQFLEAMPLTANGKIDQQALLAQTGVGPLSRVADDAPVTVLEQMLLSLWQRLLDPPRMDRHSDFFQLGGDSLLATRLIGELERSGYTATLGDLFAYPKLSAFAATLRNIGSDRAVVSGMDGGRRYEAFPLTDLQQAYLVGRRPGFELGGVGSHFFVKFAVEDLDLARFDAAWNRLINRHDMLRAIVRGDMQQVLPEVPVFASQCHHFEDLDGGEARALHESLAHTVYDPGCWPVFGVHVAQDHGNISHVYISLDNLLLDGMSMQILFAELKQLYLDPALRLPPLNIGFRDYLMRAPAVPARAEALTYWRARLPSLPPAPALPLRCHPADVAKPRFVRLNSYLAAPCWHALRARAVAHGLTPSSLLLAAYATVLSAWSRQPSLSINLTLFDRRPIHPDIEHVLGDFTSLLLLEWTPQGSWGDCSLAMQQRLRADMAHREVSAIRVMREMATREGVAAIRMPVVFTSALGYDPGHGFLDHQSWLRPIDGLSQTPQTWLDHQVYESGDTLHFNWDAVKQLFELEQLQSMFADYGQLLQRLVEDDMVWQLPWEEATPRRVFPSTADGNADITNGLAALADASACDPDVEALTQHLCRLFTELSGSSIVSGENFFEAGGSSLQLVELHGQLYRSGFTDLEVAELFSYPSPHALACRLLGRQRLAESTAVHRRIRHDSRQARRARRMELRP